MKGNIRIEEVSDVNCTFNYLEVFYLLEDNPFLEIGISDDHQLQFKFYKSSKVIMLSLDEIEYILNTAKEFFPKALKNENDFLNFELG